MELAEDIYLRAGNCEAGRNKVSAYVMTLMRSARSWFRSCREKVFFISREHNRDLECTLILTSARAVPSAVEMARYL